MEKKHVILLILLMLLIKIGYVAISVAVGHNHDSFFKNYVTALKKNDTYWYQKITENGYPELKTEKEIGYSKGADFTQSEWAFFPFYPILLKSTMSLTGLDFDTVAWFWSIFFSLALVLLFYWLSFLYFKDANKAFFSAFVMSVFPFSFYFSAFYTEGLFLTFLLACFVSVHHKNYGLLFFLIIPLVLLRPNGLVVLLPLYLYHLEQNNLLDNWKVNWKKIVEKKNLVQSFFFVSGPLVFAIYCYYQYSVTGFYNAFSIAQRGWYREFMLPVLSFFRRSDFDTQFNSWFAIAVILIVFIHRKKLPFSFNVLIFLGLLLPLTTGSVMSITRFVILLFPIYFIATKLLVKSQFKILVVTSILILHYASYWAWIKEFIT